MLAALVDTQLYLVHACWCCLVTQRKQIPLSFLRRLLLLLGLKPLPEKPLTRARPHKDISVRLVSFLNSRHTKPALLNPYDCLISSQGGYSPPFRKMTRKGGHGEAGGARRDSGGEKAH